MEFLSVVIFMVIVVLLALGVITTTQRFTDEIVAFIFEYGEWQQRHITESSEQSMFYKYLELEKMLEARGIQDGSHVTGHVFHNYRLLKPWQKSVVQDLKDPVVYHMVKSNMGLEEAIERLKQERSIEHIREQIG